MLLTCSLIIGRYGVRRVAYISTLQLSREQKQSTIVLQIIRRWLHDEIMRLSYVKFINDFLNNDEELFTAVSVIHGETTEVLIIPWL